MRKVSDVFENPDNPPLTFYSSVFPGIQRVDIDRLFGQTVEIHAVEWIDSSPHISNPYVRNGVAKFAVLLCRDPETRSLFSTHTGSIRVCGKLHTLLLMSRLPVMGTFIERPDHSYDLI